MIDYDKEKDILSIMYIFNKDQYLWNLFEVAPYGRSQGIEDLSMFISGLIKNYD